jgi:hypothetical protein
MEHRFDTATGDVWSALADPLHLGRRYGEVEGDLCLGEADAPLPGMEIAQGASTQAVGASRCTIPTL